MPRLHIPHALRQVVIARAGERCEYCLLHQDDRPESHQVDHIIALKHGGQTVRENLALACAVCNRKKGPNIASTDPEAGNAYRIVALFHPRKQRWHEHFQLQEDGPIEGLIPEGRTTARLLDFNVEERVQLRRLLMR